MKKKILLLVSLFALLACIFAVVVGADGVATEEFGVAETLENIPVDLTDTTSRVVLKGADGLYRTFPSSYIYFKTGSGNWNWRFNSGALTDALAKELKELSILYGRYYQ